MDDNKLEVKVGNSNSSDTPEPHAPGMTFHPTESTPQSSPAVDEPIESVSTPVQTPQPVTGSVSNVAADVKPPVNQAPQPVSQPSQTHDSELFKEDRPAAVAAGPEASHVVAHPHPHKQTAGKGFLREIVLLFLLLIILVAGVLAAIYFLKI